MDSLKIKKIVLGLMLASHAIGLDAAAHQERASKWSQFQEYMTQRPVIVAVLGGAAAAGVYTLAARMLNLPSLSDTVCAIGKKVVDVSSDSSIEQIKADKLGFVCLYMAIGAGSIATTAYILDVADDQYGNHSDVMKDLCTAAVEHPALSLIAGSSLAAGIGMGYGIARQNGLPPLYDLLQPVFTAPINQIKIDLLRRSSSQDRVVSIKDHLLHGVRLYLYQCLSRCILGFIQIVLAGTESAYTNAAGSQDIATEIPLHVSIIIIPLYEEVIYTYVPHSISAKAGQIFAPFMFAKTHGQYDLVGKALISVMNVLHHRSLTARPEYPYAPLISHTINNCVANVVARVL